MMAVDYYCNVMSNISLTAPTLNIILH